jgi:uncharacterized membrane protein
MFSIAVSICGGTTVNAVYGTDGACSASRTTAHEAVLRSFPVVDSMYQAIVAIVHKLLEQTNIACPFATPVVGEKSDFAVLVKSLIEDTTSIIIINWFTPTRQSALRVPHKTMHHIRFGNSIRH